jgi:hypothetical protein
VAGAQKSLAKLGYLDVTTCQGVDPSGKQDSTAGLQQAIDDAADKSLIVFFPPGTYRVSKTLDGASGRGNDGCGVHMNSVVLIGSSRGPRPTIRLADNSPAFDDPQNPRPVLHIYRWSSQGERAPCAFSNGLRGVNISVGKGNPGAVGLRFGGAQESFLEDVTVDASGGFAGISGIPGRGMGSANLEVIGGRYGLYLDTSFNGHLGGSVAGIVLRGQTERAVLSGVWGGLVLTGFEIEADHGPVIETQGKASNPGNLVLLDGTITLAKPGVAISNPGGVSVQARNLYTTGVNVLAQSPGRPDAATKPHTGWTHVRELSYCPPHKRAGGDGVDVESWSLVNGSRTQGQVFTSQPAAQPPADLVQRHIVTQKPTFEDQGTVNARDQGVVGDGQTDDAKALQAAIDTHDRVFLPKGRYRVSKTILLRAGSQLFGVPGRRSSIVRDASWKPAKQAWLIETVDDAAATTYLGDLLLESRLKSSSQKSDGNRVNAVHWRAGRRSVLNNVWLPNVNYWGDLPRQLFRISGNGGGRWYRWGDHGRMWQPGHKETRQLLIDSTSEPLTLYGCNPEHSRVSPYIEVRQSRNVRFLGCKTENMGGYDVFHVTQSENVLVAGMGQIKVGASSRIAVVQGAKNVVVLNFSPNAWDPKGAVLSEDDSGNAVKGNEYLAMYKVGDLDEKAWQTSSPPGAAKELAVDGGGMDADGGSAHAGGGGSAADTGSDGPASASPQHTGSGCGYGPTPAAASPFLLLLGLPVLLLRRRRTRPSAPRGYDRRRDHGRPVRRCRGAPRVPSG